MDCSDEGLSSMVEYAAIDIGMGLGSVELDWDPADSDKDPTLCRSGRECLDAFLLALELTGFHCCVEWEWKYGSASEARLRVCIL